MSESADDSEFRTSKGRVLGLAMTAGGIGLLVYALVTIVRFFLAVSSRASVVHFDGGGWIAFPIAIIWLILAGAILFSGKDAAEPGHSQRVLVSRLLRFSVGLLAVTIILPLTTYWGADAYLEEQGYQPCDNEQLGIRSISRSWRRMADPGNERGPLREECAALSGGDTAAPR